MSTAAVLVLNRNYSAVHVCDWKKAISLLFQGHAEAVDENLYSYPFKDWVELSKLMQEHPHGFVRSVSLRVAIPEVIRLVFYDRLPRHDVKFTRGNLMAHYKNHCGYCGKRFKTSELNLDHVVPRAQGGKTSWDNIVISCIPCNTKKADRTPVQAGMRLLVKPSKPVWQGPQGQIAMTLPIRRCISWQKLLDEVYWSAELESDM